MKMTKVDDNTIKVVKTEQTTRETTYSYEDLISQRANIIRQKEDFVAQRDKEIAEVDAILAKCKELGITSKEDK